MTNTPMMATTASMDSRDIFRDRAYVLDSKRASFICTHHGRLVELFMPELEHATFPESCRLGGPVIFHLPILSRLISTTKVSDDSM